MSLSSPNLRKNSQLPDCKFDLVWNPTAYDGLLYAYSVARAFEICVVSMLVCIAALRIYIVTLEVCIVALQAYVAIL